MSVASMLLEPGPSDTQVSGHISYPIEPIGGTCHAFNGNAGRGPGLTK
jgi:hypothetical protein